MGRPFYWFEQDDPGYDRLASWLVVNYPEWIETCAESGQLLFILAAEGDELLLSVEEAEKVK